MEVISFSLWTGFGRRADRGRGKRRVQGFLPEQSTIAQSVEQTVDIPASRGRGRRGGLQGLPKGQGSTASAVEQTIAVDRPQGFP